MNHPPYSFIPVQLTIEPTYPHSNLSTGITWFIRQYICPMKVAKGIFRLFRNKYLITLLAMAGWLLFFDRNDVFSQIERHREVLKLQSEVDYYHDRITQNRREQQELQNDDKLLEKFARENYYMKKDSEDLYIIVRDSIQ